MAAEQLSYQLEYRNIYVFKGATGKRPLEFGSRQGVFPPKDNLSIPQEDKSVLNTCQVQRAKPTFDGANYAELPGVVMGH